MNIGQVWGGSQDVNVPTLIPETNLLGNDSLDLSRRDRMFWSSRSRYRS